MKPETRFRTNQVRPFLKTLKHTAYFPIQQMAISGDADYFMCIRGQFVALELKDCGEIPRKLQQFKLDEVKRCGGISLVADPTNWQHVRKLIKRLDDGEEIE